MTTKNFVRYDYISEDVWQNGEIRDVVMASLQHDYEHFKEEWFPEYEGNATFEEGELTIDFTIARIDGMLVDEPVFEQWLAFYHPDGEPQPFDYGTEYHLVPIGRRQVMWRAEVPTELIIKDV